MEKTPINVRHEDMAKSSSMVNSYYKENKAENLVRHHPTEIRRVGGSNVEVRRVDYDVKKQPVEVRRVQYEPEARRQEPVVIRVEGGQDRRYVQPEVRRVDGGSRVVEVKKSNRVVY